MRVNSVPQIVQAFERVTGKPQDKQGGAGQNAYERQQKREEKQQEQPNEFEVIQAAESYVADELNHEHGITATTEGQGPGLRVTLKDAQGGVLRNVSGEEFLKLREAVRNGARSGRILDQKA
ncbi:MAG: hypothetical protein JST80_09985 [Bdellovibrionales bacterium]|nr:hypothetical protein [Bdellovibrionales bacterium]